MNYKKQKSPVSLRLPDDLQKFLVQEAEDGYRSLSREIVMRLEASRQADLQALAITAPKAQKGTLP